MDYHVIYKKLTVPAITTTIINMGSHTYVKVSLIVIHMIILLKIKYHISCNE